MLALLDIELRLTLTTKNVLSLMVEFLLTLDIYAATVVRLYMSGKIEAHIVIANHVSMKSRRK